MQKRQDRKSNRTRQRNKTGDGKVESNDSPEIPDRGETSDIPGLPSGVTRVNVASYRDTGINTVCRRDTQQCESETRAKGGGRTGR